LGFDASDAEREATKEAKKRARKFLDEIEGVETSSHFENLDGIPIINVHGTIDGVVEEGKILKKRTRMTREFEVQIDPKKKRLLGFTWND
jgi:hypothetical protein